jgi:hypothetical protein
MARARRLGFGQRRLGGGAVDRTGNALSGTFLTRSCYSSRVMLLRGTNVHWRGVGSWRTANQVCAQGERCGAGPWKACFPGAADSDAIRDEQKFEARRSRKVGDPAGMFHVVQRTDPNTCNVEVFQTMRLKASPPRQSPRDAPSTYGPMRVPLEVFYVVQTTGDIIGRRHHRVCPPLYETRHQAHIELVHLRAAALGRGTHSIWKAAAYVEPAEWLYDVVIADGSVVRLSDRRQKRIDRVVATG